MTASLANTAVNTGDAQGDVYISIEALQGSNFNDTLIGDDNNNFLMGGVGADRCFKLFWSADLQVRSWSVVLSAAKDLIAACNRHEILRFAQDDMRITALPTTLRSISTRKASAARSIGKRCEMCGRMTPSAASRGSSLA